MPRTMRTIYCAIPGCPALSNAWRIPDVGEDPLVRINEIFRGMGWDVENSLCQTHKPLAVTADDKRGNPPLTLEQLERLREYLEGQELFQDFIKSRWSSRKEAGEYDRE